MGLEEKFGDTLGLPYLESTLMTPQTVSEPGHHLSVHIFPCVLNLFPSGSSFLWVVIIIDLEPCTLNLRSIFLIILNLEPSSCYDNMSLFPCSYLFLLTCSTHLVVVVEECKEESRP